MRYSSFDVVVGKIPGCRGIEISALHKNHLLCFCCLVASCSMSVLLQVDFEQFKNALILVLSAAGPAGHSGMESEETMDRTAVMTTTEAVSAPGNAVDPPSFSCPDKR